MKIKRAFIISDNHFGYKNSSEKWLNLMVDWWENFLIPTIKENYREGDVLFNLGDLFDIRSSTDELIRHKVTELISKTIKLIPYYQLAGNHDVYFKSSNTVSSLDSLKHLEGDNFKIIKNAFELDKPKILFLPWENNLNILGESLQKSNKDWVFMHADIQGLRYNKNLSSLDRGLKKEALKKFKGVFSGHVHWGSSSGNIHYVGSPYQMNRGEMGNRKFIFLLDFELEKIEKFENKISPKFVAISFEELEKGNINLNPKDCVDIHLKLSDVQKFKKTLEKSIFLENFNLKYIQPEIPIPTENINFSKESTLLEKMVESLKEEKEVYEMLLKLKKEYES